MPSDRRQFNVRMSEETAARLDALLPRVARALGVELSQAQFLALAVQALEAQHPDQPAPDRVNPARKPARTRQAKPRTRKG